ncbi:hypothetical protein [Streptomyces antibioticus]|uniref:hypothetical protein n=1 Tax=Streptomyces antibioticus TaxID=1890 RepID=UPI003D746BCE
MAGEPEGALPRPVQIQGRGGGPAGSGFLITPSCVLTCAHVVTVALDLDPHSDDGPRASLPVTLLAAPGEPPEEARAEVLPGCRLPLRESSGGRRAAGPEPDRATAFPLPGRCGRSRSAGPAPHPPAGSFGPPSARRPHRTLRTCWGRLDFDAAPPRPGGSGFHLLAAGPTSWETLVTCFRRVQDAPDRRGDHRIALPHELERFADDRTLETLLAWRGGPVAVPSVETVRSMITTVRTTTGPDRLSAADL